MIDTSLFSAQFQVKLLSEISCSINLDEETDGLLIHADNFQALNLLQARYQEQVKCIYIDPPYNTGGDGFIYKDGYPHSSWLSLMDNRLQAAYPLLSQDGVNFISIDDNEQAKLKQLCDGVYGERNFVADFIRKTKSTTNDAKTGLNYQHEFALCYAKNKGLINLLGGEKDLSRYANPDNDPNGDWTTSDPSAKSGTAENNYFAVINPYTGKKDYPPTGRYWLFSKNTLQKHIDYGTICFKKEHSEDERGFIYKRYKKDLKTTQKTLDSLVFTSNEFMNQTATKELLALGLAEYFTYPKGTELIKTLLQHGVSQNSLTLDYFAGSGTTAHAVINLNREDGGRRKYILVEQGEYFDTVLKPRVAKVIYSENWKDGKPQVDKENSFNGVSQIVKVLKLESYEDTLNNLRLKQRGQLLLSEQDNMKEDYLLHYMLDIESRDSLLSVDNFRQPFDYQLNIATDSAGVYERRFIDLVETFNYLLGARVISVDDKRYERGFVAIECVLPNRLADKTLIFWRDCERIDYDGLQEEFERLGINPANSEYRQIYINGDHTLETVWDGEESGSLKILSIEEAFLSFMFGESA